MKWKKYWLGIVAVSMIIVGSLPGTTEASPDPFLKYFKKGPEIPNLKNTEWIPQGLTYLESKDWLLLSHYWTGKGSLISIVNRSSGKFVRNVELYEKQSKKLFGHVGGITVTPQSLWVSSTMDNGQNYLVQYSIDSLIKVNKEKGPLYPKKIYKLSHNPSYVTYHNKYTGKPEKLVKQLCVGKWVPQQNGNLYCYTLDNNEKLSLSKPEEYITPSDVNGVEFYGKDVNNQAYILYSRAFGRNKNSLLEIHKGLTPKNKKFNKVKDVTMYAMAEEIVQAGQQLYVSFESGAKKYADGTGTKSSHLYYGDIRNIVKK